MTFYKSLLVFRKWLPLVLVSLTLILAACTTQPLSEEVVPGTTETPGANLEPGQIVQMEKVVIGLLAVAAAVSLVTQRLRIPYTIGLVLVGLAITLVSQRSQQTISPEVILALLLPPLVFEAAFHISSTDLRRNITPILLMAIPGVILTTVLVGGLVALGAGIPLTTALVFGALIAPTDPVSVTALLRSVGAPKRLQMLLEGESLLNDGTSIVLFKLMLTFALLGEFNLLKGIVQFFVVAGGGILIGVALAVLISLVMRRVDNYLVEVTLTTVMAYGAYIAAETVFGVSGVLAVAAAGLTSSYYAASGMSPTSRIVVFNFWEYVAFLANSFIFLIIGFQTDLEGLVRNAPVILWSILAVLLARGIVVYSLSLFKKNEIPIKWRNVLFWGGLRGAVSLALVLSLAWTFPDRDQIQGMAFGVVLFTLLVQGLTLYPLLKGSGVIEVEKADLEYERRHARATAMRAAQARLHGLHEEGIISDYIVDALQPIIEERIEQFVQEEQDTLETEPVLRHEALEGAWRETLRAQRNSLSGLFRDHIISEEVYVELISEVDRMIEEDHWPELDKAVHS